MPEALQLPIVQRGLIELLVLAIPAGVLGTLIILRGRTFFTHAVSTASFPGVVAAVGVGVSPPLGAVASALAFGATTGTLSRKRLLGGGVATALALSAFLAIGVILASNVFRSGASVDQILFGSLFLVGPVEIAVSAGAGLLALGATWLFGSRWTAGGFDPAYAPLLGAGTRVLEFAFIGLIALTAAAMIPVTGALLVGALLVIPAATTRLLTDRLVKWQAATVALVALEGVVGIWIAIELDLAPGPVIAVLTGAVFLATALADAIHSKWRPSAEGRKYQ